MAANLPNDESLPLQVANDQNYEHLCAGMSCVAGLTNQPLGGKVPRGQRVDLWPDDDHMCLTEDDGTIVFMYGFAYMPSWLVDMTTFPVWTPDAPRPVAAAQALEAGTVPTSD